MARVYCKIEKCRNWKDINDGICPPCITKKKKFADSQKGVQTPIWPCGVCQEPCTDGIRALNCDSCKIWYHTACVDISDEVYDVVMMSAFGKAAKWPCSKCEQRVEELFEKSRTIEDAQEKMVETMGKVIDRLEKVEDKLTGKVHKELSGAINERADIERRKLNLLIYNLPEAESDNTTAWDTNEERDNDSTAISKIFETELNINMTSKIIGVNRLGGKKRATKVGETVRPRALKITFSYIMTKREVLKRSKDLRNSQDKIAMNIFVNPDLTEFQRAKDKELREKMWELREKHNRNVIVRRGEIVDVDWEVRKQRKPAPVMKSNDNATKSTPTANDNNDPEKKNNTVKPTSTTVSESTPESDASPQTAPSM